MSRLGDPLPIVLHSAVCRSCQAHIIEREVLLYIRFLCSGADFVGCFFPCIVPAVGHRQGELCRMQIGRYILLLQIVWPESTDFLRGLAAFPYRSPSFVSAPWRPESGRIFPRILLRGVARTRAETKELSVFII